MQGRMGGPALRAGSRRYGMALIWPCGLPHGPRRRSQDMTAEASRPPLAIEAAAAPPRTKPSNYPEPFFSRMAKRQKRPLGDMFGLKNFGVNLTRLEPG